MLPLLYIKCDHMAVFKQMVPFEVYTLPSPPPAPLCLSISRRLVLCCGYVCCQLLLCVVVPFLVVLLHHVTHGLQTQQQLSLEHACCTGTTLNDTAMPSADTGDTAEPTQSSTGLCLAHRELVSRGQARRCVHMHVQVTMLLKLDGCGCFHRG
jgi:hypothetical protein